VSKKERKRGNLKWEEKAGENYKKGDREVSKKVGKR